MDGSRTENVLLDAGLITGMLMRYSVDEWNEAARQPLLTEGNRRLVALTAWHRIRLEEYVKGG